jgi:hypothetical protein
VSVHTDEVGELLDAYDIQDELGRGAWGIVRRARHRQLGRPVAVKQLSAAFGADPSARARFAAEARLIASLDHPHIVPAYDYVERAGSAVIVMEYLPGGTLWQRFLGPGVGPEEAVAYLLAVTSALHFAHQRSILHRDVKPDNLLFNSRGVLKLTDFGLAGALSARRSARSGAGTVVGTPAYIAPERVTGDALAPSSDVYSAAVVLYELLAGRLPFPAPSDPLAQLYQHVYEVPQPLAEVAPAIPPGLAEVVMRALEKKPAARYPGADDFGVALACAATAAWGPGWLQATGVAVMDAHALAAASRPSPAPDALGARAARRGAAAGSGPAAGRPTLPPSGSRATLGRPDTRPTDPRPVPGSPAIELSPVLALPAPDSSRHGGHPAPAWRTASRNGHAARRPKRAREESRPRSPCAP